MSVEHLRVDFMEDSFNQAHRKVFMFLRWMKLVNVTAVGLLTPLPAMKQDAFPFSNPDLASPLETQASARGDSSLREGLTHGRRMLR